MERTSKGRALRLEVSETDKRVWFRLYSHDAAEVRGELDPGTIVYIRARVSEYLRKGGFLVELEPEDPRPSDGATHVIRQLEDKFSLEVPTLELFLFSMDPVEEVTESRSLLDRLRLVGLDESVRDALNWIRQGLDAPGFGTAVEHFHEAEQILSDMLGQPVWTRPE